MKTVLFYLTNEQAEKKVTAHIRPAYMCSYSYFPRVEGMLDDGINAFSMEYQQEEFYKNQPTQIFRNVLMHTEWKIIVELLR